MFSTVVNLYRALGRPVYEADRVVTLEKICSPQEIALLDSCGALPQHFGTYEYQPKNDGSCSIDIHLPLNEHCAFFKNTAEFIESTPSLRRGSFRGNFYLADIDYASSDAVEPELIHGLKRLVKFAGALTNFAGLSVDSAELVKAGKLIFIRPPDGKKPQQTILVPVVLDAALVNAKLNHAGILIALTNPELADRIHIDERRLIMGGVIADTLSECPEKAEAFAYLVNHWSEVVEKYRHNLQAYINNFSFDAVKKKLADAEVEYSAKLSSTLGEMTGKILAIPVALAALIPLAETKTPLKFSLGLLGMLTVFIIYRLMIHNFQLQARRLQDSFDLIFDPFVSKLKNYPAPLREVINKRKEQIAKQSRFLNFTFWVFVGLAYMPLLGGILVGYRKFDSQIFDWVSTLLTRWTS